MIRRLRVVFALTLGAAGTQTIDAQAPGDSALFASLRWRNIGPNRGGRSIAVAGSTSRPLEYYFGATGGGLWKTVDGGTTWAPVTDGQIRSSSVGAVVVAESNPDVVYMGMGEAELRGNIMQGDGVYRSADAGKSWSHAGLEKTQSISRVRIDPALLAVVVDRPGNPGNLGTLIRSCDAFGVNGIILSGHGVDLYEPATVTASRGSLFAVPVVRVPSHEDTLRWVTAVRTELGGCRVLGTDEAGSIDLHESDFLGPTVLLLGNESHGLSHAYRELCDDVVRIPMVGSATSLNVSVAASIVLYEAVRQRRLRRHVPTTASTT